MFTARSRQNPFAKRRRAQAAQEPVVPAPESSPEPPEPKPVQTEASLDGGMTPDHAETTDIGAIAGSGVDESPLQRQGINAETQARIDEIMNRAVPPVELLAEIDEDSPIAPLPNAENVERKAPAVDEPKRGRGRPRPQATIDRDNAVHKLLKAADEVEGVSKEALALALDEKEQQVYSSLRQLSKEGRAETRYVKDHGYRWFAITEEN